MIEKALISMHILGRTYLSLKMKHTVCKQMKMLATGSGSVLTLADGLSNFYHEIWPDVPPNLKYPSNFQLVIKHEVAK